jgi:ribose transport system ATP-binding protein
MTAGSDRAPLERASATCEGSALHLSGISKAFGSTQALWDASLSVNAGEVHGLIGLNGSGKSTLVKVLSGYLTPDRTTFAECRVWGKPVTFPVASPEHRGITVVQQDLALCKEMSVADNINVAGALGTATSPLTRVRHRDESRQLRDTFKRLRWDIDSSAIVGKLTAGEQAMVSIARALTIAERRRAEGSILVLDEPTAYLTQEDSDKLFAVVRDLVAAGHAAIIVSHRLDDIQQLCQRVTVLRGGIVVGSAAIRDVTKRSLTTMMTGQEVQADPPPVGQSLRSAASADAVLELDNLNCGRAHSVSLSLRQGEILGCTGLLGSGPEELPLAILGVRSRTGAVRLHGRALTTHTPSVVRSGIAIVPEDRLRKALWREGQVIDNLGLDIVRRRGWRQWFVRRRDISRSARHLIRQYGVVAPSAQSKMWRLSGGNQQKVVLARALESVRPEVLVLHEPTAGVDVDARASIYAFIRQKAAEGLSVLLCSSDVEEVAALSNRILVFKDGEVIREMVDGGFTPQAVAMACQGKDR